ncbi:MAG: S8 family serine peptidase, partial [Sciscionella sp.]|nr:S8 family serine peptidase [Sciscionella sp.]
EMVGPDRAYSAQASADTDHDLAKTDRIEHTGARPATVSTADRTGEQWDMRLIDAGQAHKITEGSRDVLVGVLDSGIDPNHPDLRPALDPADSAGCVDGVAERGQSSWAPTTSGHGTHVAGIIAAADDGKGITGVAPGVRIASVKVVDDSGYIYPEAAVCGLMWAAARHMSITNNSYFVDPWLFACDDSTGQHVVYQAMKRAVDYATAHGVLNIAAAGNSGVDLTSPGDDANSPDNAAPDQRTDRQLGDDCATLPAGLPGVLAVSSVGPGMVKASYSAYGLGAIDVAGPGGDREQASAVSTSNADDVTASAGSGVGNDGAAAADDGSSAALDVNNATHDNSTHNDGATTRGGAPTKNGSAEKTSAVTTPAPQHNHGTQSVEDNAGADDGCVLSTVPGGYGYECGTSMAAPHVTGVAALLASKHPHASPAQLTNLLNATASPLSCPSDYDLSGTGAQDAYCTGYAKYNSFYGHGMVNALNAVAPTGKPGKQSQ